MKGKLLYLLFGSGLGAGSHYGYRYYNPERNVTTSTQGMINSFVSSHNLQQGYLINVLKSVGLMLKGFYHYGMDTKIRGFNFNSTYLDRDQVKDPEQDIKHLYCIFSPTDYICGHPEIQHGGATATIIDQNMGYLAILHSKEMVATGDLHIKYKKPIKKDQYYVLETQVTERKGRKIWVKGTIKELETGEVKVQSTALFFTVNWDNQMSRILTRFFQAINFKDYAEEQLGGYRIHQDYKQQQKIPPSQETPPSPSPQPKKLSRSEKLIQIKQLKKQLLNRGSVNKEYDRKVEELQVLVDLLEKKDSALHVVRAEGDVGVELGQNIQKQ